MSITVTLKDGTKRIHENIRHFDSEDASRLLVILASDGVIHTYNMDYIMYFETTGLVDNVEEDDE